jgi:glycosyltransferase involved in cell wall biosynthesis
VKIVLFANTDWYLWNFRRSLALALSAAGHDVLLISPDGPYGEKLRVIGLCWQPVPMDRRSLNPLRETLLLLHLVRLLHRERPDIVHSFTIKCAVYGSLAARLAGVPGRVNAVAGMGYVFISESLRARVLRPLVRGLLRVALGGRNARLILQNPDDVALFRETRLANARHVRLIPGSGVDCGRFQPATGRRVGARLRVLLPTRLLWDKGLAEFAQAAKLLQEREVPVDLLLAGEPDPGNPAAVPEAAVLGRGRQRPAGAAV